MNVVLIGYRGVGKSAVAELVARRLALEPRSSDKLIVERARMPIPQIVQERGWSGFRDLEQEVCAELARGDQLVIDCGGGVVEREANRSALRQAGTVFWLTASVATIVHRIGGDRNRPSLTGTKSITDEVEEVLARRRPLYAEMAHHTVHTDQRSIPEVAQEIAAALRRE